MYIAYLIMNIIDIILSKKYVDITTEANPVQQMLWSSFGFNAVIYLKLLSMVMFSIIYFYLLKQSKKHAKFLIYAVNIIMLYPMMMFIFIYINTLIDRF